MGSKGIGRTYPRIQVSTKAERAIKAGHPWVYAAEVESIDGVRIERSDGPSLPAVMPTLDGKLVDIVSRASRYLGTAWYNSASKIRARILSTNANDRFDAAFFERRVRYAWNYRKSVLGDAIGACRIIASEADQMPGLTVDRFDDILVARTLCRGMDEAKHLVLPALYRVLTEDDQHISGIYERNDTATRHLEGLSEGCGFYRGNGVPVPGPCVYGATAVPLSAGGTAGGKEVDNSLDAISLPRSTARICENGVLYDVDFVGGQKTGFFLDQKLNRAAAAHIASGRTVLDCFTHTGSFGLNAALAGAVHVHSVDISSRAIEMARHNAILNGLTEEQVDYEVADVFELLEHLADLGHPYDYVILDPPAFAKNRASVPNALRGYREINRRAMQMLPRGGFLATASCSHFVTDEMFREMLTKAAQDAQVSLRQIEARSQAPDHPILWGVPETAYLKFYLFQVF